MVKESYDDPLPSVQNHIHEVVKFTLKSFEPFSRIFEVINLLNSGIDSLYATEMINFGS